MSCDVVPRPVEVVEPLVWEHGFYGVAPVVARDGRVQGVERVDDACERDDCVVGTHVVEESLRVRHEAGDVEPFEARVASVGRGLYQRSSDDVEDGIVARRVQQSRQRVVFSHGASLDDAVRGEVACGLVVREGRDDRPELAPERPFAWEPWHVGLDAQWRVVWPHEVDEVVRRSRPLPERQLGRP